MNFNLTYFGALALVLVFYGLIYYLKQKKNVDFGVLTILAVGFGIVVGLVFKGGAQYYAAFGSIYTNLISAVVVPLLIFSIISSITNLGEEVRLKNIGWKAVVFLLLNTLTASILAIVAAVVTNIGKGFNYQLATNYKAQEVPTFIDTIVGLVPSNLASHWVEGQVVPIVIFAIIIAVAYNKLAAEKTEGIGEFKKIIDAGNKVMGRVVSFIIELTPYAVLSLIGRAVSQNKLSDLLPLLSVLVLVYILCAIQLFGVDSLLLAVVGKLNPIQFLKGFFPAGVVAFTSQSSIGTIPVTTKQLTKKLGVNEDISTFVATLGANLGMPACAGIWPMVTAVFTIHILGLNYSFSQYALLIILAVVVAVGTVGVPGTSTITTTAIFVAAGLPVEAIVLLSPISSIVDMARTATNVAGAATSAVLVAKTEGQLDLEVYNEGKTETNTAGQADSLA